MRTVAATDRVDHGAEIDEFHGRAARSGHPARQPGQVRAPGRESAQLIRPHRVDRTQQLGRHGHRGRVPGELVGGHPGLLTRNPRTLGQHQGRDPGGGEVCRVGFGIAVAGHHDVRAGQLRGDCFSGEVRPDKRDDGTIRRRSAQRCDLGCPDRVRRVPRVGAFSKELVHGVSPRCDRPRVTARPDRPAPMTIGRTVAPGRGATVVIIDDHQVFAELLGEVLVSHGLDVVGIHSALEGGMAAVAERAPDLVILDHRLPGDTGASSVRALKRSSPTTRVLMLTAADERAVLLEAMNAGCDGFVTKRQDINEVMAAVAAVLRGDTPISPDMAGALIGEQTEPTGRRPDLARVRRLAADRRRSLESAGGAGTRDQRQHRAQPRATRPRQARSTLPARSGRDRLPARFTAVQSGRQSSGRCEHRDHGPRTWCPGTRDLLPATQGSPGHDGV